MGNNNTEMVSVNDASEARSLLDLYNIKDDDMRHIRRYGEIIVPKLDKFVDLFYDWLRGQPEFDEFFPDSDVPRHVSEGLSTHWRSFFQDEVDEVFLSRVRHVGETHARIGLGLNIYFAAVNTSLKIITEDLYDKSLGPDDYTTAVKAIIKLALLDANLIVETYARLTGEAVSAQSRSLMEMSTPVTQIWSGVLFLPIVGIIDSKRAQDIMNATLKKIAETSARAYIMDISGVAVVDTAVANYLIKVTKATRLMGCECTISGVSPAIAQTMVELGIDVGTVKTTATMQDALFDVFRRMGADFTKPR